jgi:charged multivesicular body protein 3
MDWFFGCLPSFLRPLPSLEDKVREWKKEIHREERGIDRSVREIESQQMKTRMDIKSALKRVDRGSAQVLARELLRSRRAVERLHKNKSSLRSLSMALTHSLTTMRVHKNVVATAEVVRSMNDLLGELPAFDESLRAMALEVFKSEELAEKMGDTLELEEDEQEEADEEVEKVLMELLPSPSTLDRLETNKERERVEETLPV